MNKQFWYIFSVSFIVFLGIAILIVEQYKNRTHELITKNSFLEGQIIKIKPSHGSSYIELESGRKVMMPQSKNYKYSPPGFSEIASVGDTITKGFDNDTLYLFQCNKKYVFKIGSALNLPA